MQSAKTRGSPKDSLHKASPRPARQLKINPTENSSPSSSNHASGRIPKTRSPKVIERKSPRSPISEKKRPSKLSELESQITQLQDDLKKVKDQLIISESSKREAEEDAEQAKKKLADVSLQLEESQKQVSMLVASKEADVADHHQNISVEKEQDWEVQIESARKQHSIESDALESAYGEIQRLKQQLEMIAESKDTQGKQRESTDDDLQSLKSKLAETISLVETVKIELEGSKESEAQAKDLVKETLHQLEAAKETINTLKSDVNRSTEAYNIAVSEPEHSRAHAILLENTVSKLNVDEISDHKLEDGVSQLRSDLGLLKSALEAADLRCNEEQSRSKDDTEYVSQMLEEIKIKSKLRETKLEEELKKTSVEIDELKATLMDKETELQGISEENECLNMKLEKSMSSQREQELENQLKELKQLVENIKANVMDKETELQNILEENEMLKLEMKKRESVVNDQVAGFAVVEESRSAEKEAAEKIGYMMEEVDKSKRKAMRITEQLEVAQKANAEMEAELRRLKVQSDQWRKAAEAAATMLTPGSNGKFVERTGSMPVDNSYSPIGARLGSPFLDDFDEDSFKKKNGNVLKKIGVLWKKPPK